MISWQTIAAAVGGLLVGALVVWLFRTSGRSGQGGLSDPKFIIAYTIILGFAAAYIHNPDDTMKGALIAAFAGAWGFYLGSSNSSNQIREQVGKSLDLAKASADLAASNAPEQKPDVILKPGETAQAETDALAGSGTGGAMGRDPEYKRFD